MAAFKCVLINLPFQPLNKPLGKPHISSVTLGTKNPISLLEQTHKLPPRPHFAFLISLFHSGFHKVGGTRKGMGEKGQSNDRCCLIQFLEPWTYEVFKGWFISWGGHVGFFQRTISSSLALLAPLPRASSAFRLPVIPALSNYYRVDCPLPLSFGVPWGPFRMLQAQWLPLSTASIWSTGAQTSLPSKKVRHSWPAMTLYASPCS